MFKNLTGVTNSELTERIALLGRNIEVKHCPILVTAFSELINKYRSKQPFRVQLIHAILSRNYSTVFLNSGCLVSVSFNRKKEANVYNENHRKINNHHYQFRFCKINKLGKPININEFIIDEDQLSILSPIIDRTELTDALTQALNGMPHDDLHNYLSPSRSIYLDPDNRYLSKISQTLNALFGNNVPISNGEALGNYEAFIMGLHAARLKFTKTGKVIYQKHIEALNELFSICAKSRDTALQSNLLVGEYYEALCSIQYVETIAMRAAWHLTQPGEAAYEKIENHFTQLRIQHLDQVKQTNGFAPELAAELMPLFTEIFQSVHLAMEADLNSQSSGPIHFGGEIFTPITLIKRMHKDGKFASNIGEYLFAAYAADSVPVGLITRKQFKAPVA